MATEKSPAFSFYAKDFLTGTVTMSLAERGALITSVCRAVATDDRAFFTGRQIQGVGRVYWRPSYRRPHIPLDVRRAVMSRDGETCVKCGSNERPTLDHVFPYSKGGEDLIDNLQVLCSPCNRRKGATV